jgi:alpha/beta superfamily hydrolase
MTFGTVARSRGATETPLFFGGPGRKKFGVLHVPDDAPRFDPILVCHPHFEEKLWAHRVLLDFARAAAARGHVVLRFDYAGHGDSEGEFEEFGFAEIEADVNEAHDLLGERTGAPPVAFGLRFGALLAGRLAARTGGRAALWEPVVDPEQWLFEALRAQMAFQLTAHGKVVRNRKELVRDLEGGGTVVLEGYGLTGTFYREATVGGGLTGEAFPGRCASALVVSVQPKVPPGPGTLQDVARVWSERAAVSYRHVEEQPFWSDIRRHRTRSPELTRLTLDWIEGRGTAEDGA